MNRFRVLRPAVLVACLLAAACTAAADDGAVTVTIGYQSKTINTVTAGTLLRERGILERRLAELGRQNGKTYEVEWQDYPSGPPITAQMVAGKIDIGSMGDYPALVNGAETRKSEDSRTSLMSITGYNLRGSLNAVVVRKDSPARTLADLEGQSVSTSIGSAAHGMLVKSLDGIGKPREFVTVMNQEPSVGATALESGQVAALAQFVPWPEVLIYRGIARKLHDGGDNGVATMHGVVMRQAFTKEHPEVAEAFLASQLEATTYLHEHPLEAAQTVSRITGLEAEVVYLFNGPNGIVSFDPTIKPQLRDALATDVPFLESLGSLSGLDLGEFIDDSLIRKVHGDGYDRAVAATTNPSALRGTDEVCGIEVSDPTKASEAWFKDEDATVVAATPTCLLRLVRSHGRALRAAYVPDARTGTRLFAHTANWVEDPSAGPMDRFLAFATVDAAGRYVSEHPGSSTRTFDAAQAAT